MTTPDTGRTLRCSLELARLLESYATAGLSLKPVFDPATPMTERELKMLAASNAFSRTTFIR